MNKQLKSIGKINKKLEDQLYKLYGQLYWQLRNQLSQQLYWQFRVQLCRQLDEQIWGQQQHKLLEQLRKELNNG